MNIFESKITAGNIKFVYESREKKPRVGEMFFKPVKQMGIELNLIKGKDNAPVALVAANYDTDVLYRDRIGFEELKAEMPYFKEAYKMGEQLRQKIITAQEQYRGMYFNEVFKDADNLIEGADITAEAMRMQLLSSGTVAIAENGVAKDYNYGFVKANQMVTESGTKLWSDSSAKPFASFISYIKNYKKKMKVAAKYAVMNTDVFDALANDSDVVSYFSNLSTPNLYPNELEVKTYLEQKSQVTIIICDDEYIKARDNSKTYVPYYPQDRFTLLSTLDMGETVYGSTPEEIDLLSGNSNVLSCEVVGNGVAVTTWKEVDPVCVSVKASEVVLPSCPNIDKVYIVKVL